MSVKKRNVCPLKTGTGVRFHWNKHIIGLIRNGLNMSHVDVYWDDFVKGLIIILAVLLDSLRKNIQVKLLERSYLG